MWQSCSIKAHVKNQQGEIVESKLFNDLHSFFGSDRSSTVKYYAAATDPEFIKTA